MRFLLLGPLEAWEEGRELELGRGKQRALLALLLLHANEVVSSDCLIENLWGDRAPASAAKLVQGHVSQLRRGLGVETIRTRGPGYVLYAEETDAGEFEWRVEQARGQPPRQAARTLRAALALWRGPPLVDVSYESWAQAEIARLDELRLVAAEELFAARLLLGEAAELVPELESFAFEHPLRERLHSQLMVALYRSGRQAEALEAYQQARRRLVEELGIEPGPELQELHRAILNQEAALAAVPAHAGRRRFSSSLPAPANALIGRRAELRALKGLLLGEARLVTLTGAGGSGKTRLAVEVASFLQGEFGQEVYFVPLATVRQPELVPATIVQGLGVMEAAGEPQLQTLTKILDGQDLLLVLDNFEHLGGAAPMLAALLAGCPRLSLLVTSRASLHLSGEHEYPLDPLPLEHAIALFTERAQAVRPGFAAEEGLLEAICTRLDCLPLALELAAARSRVLSAEELLGRLGRRLELLTGGPSDLASRHQTLRATIEWSYRLLDSAERQLFARLAVFAGGCTVAAAERVCGGSLEQLESLVGKNLVQRRESSGVGRFSMLETIREYALEQLAAAEGLERTRRAHAEHYLDLARRGVEELDRAERATLDRVERELDNLRAAFVWAQESKPDAALRFAADLSGYWFVRGRLVEGRRWFDAVLERPRPGSRPLATVTAELARLCFFLGDLETATERADQALDLAETLELPDVLSEALTTKSLLAEKAGSYEESLSLLERALAIGREHNLGRPLLRSLSNLSAEMAARDRHVEARAIDLEGLELSRQRGDRHFEQFFLNNLVTRNSLLGDWATAIAAAQELQGPSLPGGFFGWPEGLPWLEVQRGLVEKARRSLEAHGQLASHDDMQARVTHAFVDAVILRAEGRQRKALTAAEKALAARYTLGVRDTTVKWAFVEAVETALALDDLDRVAELLGEFESFPPSDQTPFLAAHHARFCALLAARRSEDSVVEPGLTRAATVFGELSMPFYVAVTLLEHGEWLAARGHPDHAEPLFAEARETFARLEARPWLERVEIAKAATRAEILSL
jgi:predicted ATPase/DNA-binding SARP family transcriptional activator